MSVWRLAIQPVNLPFIPGADDEPAFGVEREIVRRIVARFPELIPYPVRRDAVDRAFGCARSSRVDPGPPPPGSSPTEMDVISVVTVTVGTGAREDRLWFARRDRRRAAPTERRRSSRCIYGGDVQHALSSKRKARIS